MTSKTLTNWYQTHEYVAKVAKFSTGRVIVLDKPEINNGYPPVESETYVTLQR